MMSSSYPTDPKAAGFTLVEVLVAAALVAVLSTLSFMAISSAARTQEVLRAHSERGSKVEIMVARMRQDLFSMSTRAVRDDSGDFLGAFAFGRGRSDYDLEFTRNSRAPLLVTDTGFERVAYEVENENLYRYSWAVLDRPTGARPTRTLLMTEVDSLDVRAFDSGGDWRDTWPQGTGDDINYQLLPELVELTIEFRELGDIRLLVPGLREPAIENAN